MLYTTDPFDRDLACYQAEIDADDMFQLAVEQAQEENDLSYDEACAFVRATREEAELDRGAELYYARMDE